MPESRTKVQQNYLRSIRNEAVLGATPEELAAAADGDITDFNGLRLVKPNPTVVALMKQAQDRPLWVGSMSTNGEKPIGFAQIVEDLRPFAHRLIDAFQGLKQRVE